MRKKGEDATEVRRVKVRDARQFVYGQAPAGL
jgi:hypothetical protein